MVKGDLSPLVIELGVRQCGRATRDPSARVWSTFDDAGSWITDLKWIVRYRPS